MGHPVAAARRACEALTDDGTLLTIGLGVQAGPDRLLEVLSEAGFSHRRVATETPFDLVLEARP